MTTMFKAVIFDLDGVIADTVEYHYLSTKRVAEEEDLSFSRERNQKMQGRSRADLIDELVKNSRKVYSPSEKQKLGERKNHYFQQYIAGLSQVDILPGVYELLRELKENRIKMAIASSSSNARTTLSNLGITHLFDCVVDTRTIRQMKPDPEIFLQAAERLDTACGDCIAMEDGEAGMKAIKQTPMFSVGIGSNDVVKTADWHVRQTSELSFSKLTYHFSQRRNS
ncbi:beta-phosphoglucomutase [Evansella caseinilytica]|uniref:Beta-phosphoglucomutase n=1 Tax=Evansella caseinilytica TaxID=1503961 RepID=A0A1H3P1W6_9BACI|nr:beta-phosphoglucomutase [Evansella caseinilytica]SDY95102.1 beta-phosphoglucomutase [Evansella caseinilytica]